MASPQAEDGHTDIANDVMEALGWVVLYPDEWNCVMVILRKTWGWHKKEDWISLGQFAESTGIPRDRIPRVLKKLIAKNIIIKRVVHTDNTPVVRAGNTLLISYGFQKDYEKWKVLSRRTTAVQADNTGVVQADYRVLSRRTPTKENIQKKITKEKYSSSSADDGFDRFWNCYPKKIGKTAASKKWKTLQKDKKLPGIESILKAIEEQKSCEQWKKEGGQFIPHPKTWLNQGRWEDQPADMERKKWNT